MWPFSLRQAGLAVCGRLDGEIVPGSRLSSSPQSSSLLPVTMNPRFGQGCCKVGLSSPFAQDEAIDANA